MANLRREKNLNHRASLEDIPRVRPSNQDRSLAKRRELMAAATRLLRTENFEQVTIGRIAAEAGCSVGAFYDRFADKDSLLTALQEDIFWRQIDQARQELSAELWQSEPDDAAIRAAILFVIRTFTGEAEGVLRAALIQSASKPVLWDPAKRSGPELGRIVIELIATRLKRDDAESAVLIGLQLLYGVLVNMILHDPGPLKLNSPKAQTLLVEAI